MARFGMYEHWQDGTTWYYLVRHKRIGLGGGLELVLAFDIRPHSDKRNRLTEAERTPRPYRQREDGIRLRLGRVVRGFPYKSRGSSVSSRPRCMANKVAVERVDAPILA